MGPRRSVMNYGRLQVVIRVNELLLAENFVKGEARRRAADEQVVDAAAVAITFGLDGFKIAADGVLVQPIPE